LSERVDEPRVAAAGDSVRIIVGIDQQTGRYA
jgi:hypothetical protein